MKAENILQLLPTVFLCLIIIPTILVCLFFQMFWGVAHGDHAFHCGRGGKTILFLKHLSELNEMLHRIKLH